MVIHTHITNNRLTQWVTNVFLAIENIWSPIGYMLASGKRGYKGVGGGQFSNFDFLTPLFETRSSIRVYMRTILCPKTPLLANFHSLRMIWVFHLDLWPNSNVSRKAIRKDKQKDLKVCKEWKINKTCRRKKWTIWLYLAFE